MVPPRRDTDVKRNDGCFYFGKFGHFAKDCRKRKFDESKYKRNIGNFVDNDFIVRDDFKNIIFIFIFDVSFTNKN